MFWNVAECPQLDESPVGEFILRLSIKGAFWLLAIFVGHRGGSGDPPRWLFGGSEKWRDGRRKEEADYGRGTWEGCIR